MANIFPQGVRFRLLVAILAAIALACGPTETVDSPPPAKPAPGNTSLQTNADAFRIVFLGNSLSAGYGLAESQAFPILVQEQLQEQGHPVEVVNAGVSGDTTAGGLSRLDWVLRSEPHLIVVELGGNDALRGQPLANTENNLREIVRRGRASGAEVLLLGMDVPTNYGPEYAEGFNELYWRIAEEEDVALLPDFIRDVALDPSLMMADGLHPTAEGHRKLAESLVIAIGELLPS